MSNVKTTLALAIIVVIIVGPLWITARTNARHHFAQGKALMDSGEVELASAQLQKALSWYSPYDGVPAQAARLLSDLSEGEKLSDQERMAVLYALKRGLMSSRNFGASLLSAWHVSSLAQVTAKLEAFHLEGKSNSVKELHPPRVSFLWQILSQLFFWSWLLSVGALISFGFDRDGKLKRRSALWSGSLALTCYGFWLVALSMA